MTTMQRVGAGSVTSFGPGVPHERAGHGAADTLSPVSAAHPRLRHVAITLQTRLRPSPDNDAVDPYERRQVEATGQDYETARASLGAQVPDGWQMLGISRW
jgi:hypothetical protein